MLMKLRYDMSLKCIPMSEQDAIAICSWTYETPYDIYNWPKWEQLVLDQCEFADEHIRLQQYYSIKNEHQQLVAFVQFFPLVDTIRLAIFVEPTLLNRGIGKLVSKLAVQTAKQNFIQPYIDLEVTKWNTAAIHVYEQVGFVIEDEYELFNTRLQKNEAVFNMVYHQKKS